MGAGRLVKLRKTGREWRMKTKQELRDVVAETIWDYAQGHCGDAVDPTKSECRGLAAAALEALCRALPEPFTPKYDEDIGQYLLDERYNYYVQLKKYGDQQMGVKFLKKKREINVSDLFWELSREAHVYDVMAQLILTRVGEHLDVEKISRAKFFVEESLRLSDEAWAIVYKENNLKPSQKLSACRVTRTIFEIEESTSFLNSNAERKKKLAEHEF